MSEAMCRSERYTKHDKWCWMFNYWVYNALRTLFLFHFLFVSSKHLNLNKKELILRSTKYQYKQQIFWFPFYKQICKMIERIKGSVVLWKKEENENKPDVTRSLPNWFFCMLQHRPLSWKEDAREIYFHKISTYGMKHWLKCLHTILVKLNRFSIQMPKKVVSFCVCHGRSFIVVWL